CARDHSGFDFL
nr:immunoglobulin heavy chain junction region [Macaca mulatta]